MDTNFLHSDVGWHVLHNSYHINDNLDFELPTIIQHLVSSLPLDCSVDLIHNLYCVDIVHCNTINLRSSLLWTYILSSIRSLYSGTHDFWHTFTHSPLSNLLVEAHRQFYTWFLHVDCFAKIRICKVVQHIAALLYHSMFLKHDFVVHKNSFTSIGNRASRRYLSCISF